MYNSIRISGFIYFYPMPSTKAFGYENKLSKTLMKGIRQKWMNPWIQLEFYIYLKWPHLHKFEDNLEGHSKIAWDMIQEVGGTFRSYSGHEQNLLLLQSTHCLSWHDCLVRLAALTLHPETFVAKWVLNYNKVALDFIQLEHSKQ